MKKTPFFLALSVLLAMLVAPLAAHGETRATDPNPPILISAAISCENAKVGDRVVISWNVEDSDGVATINIVVDAPDGSQMTLPSPLGDSASKGSVDIDITSNMAVGEYRVSSIRVEDKSGYVTELTNGLERLVFYVETSQSDDNLPVLLSASVSPKSASIGEVVTISWDIADADGVKSVNAVVDCPNGSQMMLSSPAASPDKNSCEIDVTSDMTPGVYRVSAFEVQDRVGYHTAIPVETLALEFTITSGGSDPNVPRIAEVSIDRQVAAVGDVVTITWRIDDADGVKYSAPIISCPDGAQMMLGSPLDQEKTCKCELRITSDMLEGEYELVAIKVGDKLGYVTELAASNLGLSFVVTDGRSNPSYKVIEGNNSKHIAGSTTGLRFRFDGPAERFTLLEVDGDVVAENYYTVESGSTIIVLSTAYLDTLATGEHVATAYYDDNNRASANFEIVREKDGVSAGSTSGENKKSESNNGDKDNGGQRPKTGNNLAQTGDMLPLHAATLMVVAASLMVIAVVRRHCIEP